MDDRWRIRPATLADVPAIAAGEARCFSDPWSAAGLAELFDNPLTTGLVAEAARGGLAGYLFARVVAGEAEILNLAVLPELRGKGLGGALLAEGLAGIRAAAGAVYLEVRESNQAARRLYERAGFRSVGMRMDYYRAPRENGVLYRLELAAESK
ncbi:MAG: ribosomal protein S18-alanine N-acetyltransferase [Gemmatimonadales bacterium]